MRVLVVQRHLDPFGGGEAVCAWILQALQDEHEVGFFCWTAPDFEVVNRFYGTAIRPSRIRVTEAIPGLPRRITRTNTLRLLKLWSLFALARRVRDVDLLISVEEESDLGGRGLQYIHYPRLDPARIHGAGMRLYHALIARLTDTSLERMRQNLTLVNSDWTGRVVRRFHGIDTVTLNPPAPGDYADVPWQERDTNFVAVGRLSGEKRYDLLIRIVGELRERGHDVGLHLVVSGPMNDYGHKLLRRAGRHAWVKIHRDLSRPELDRLLTRHRYGLHGMREEHYGMAVAEMVRAGMIVFVPHGGGQVEIVDDQRLLWHSQEEAVQRIQHVLDDQALQHTLLHHLQRRNEHLRPERFVTDVRRLVAGLSKPPPKLETPGYDPPRAPR